jgi:hypothetical protein
MNDRNDIDICQRLGGYVWCSVVRDFIVERWQIIVSDPSTLRYHNHFGTLCSIFHIKILGRITTPLLKLPITKIVIKVNKNDIDLCNYNLPERDEFVTKVIRVMIKFNKGVVIRPIVSTF